MQDQIVQELLDSEDEGTTIPYNPGEPLAQLESLATPLLESLISHPKKIIFFYGDIRLNANSRPCTNET